MLMYEIMVESSHTPMTQLENTEKNTSKKVSGPVASNANRPTSTDYIIEAMDFFKTEYNKVRLRGLTYEYSIGVNAWSADDINDPTDDHRSRRLAVERLRDSGSITELVFEERAEGEGSYVWDYALCKIDETQITEEKLAPLATDEGVDEVIKKTSLYITKIGQDFLYKGKYLTGLSTKSDYYRVFSALYAKLPSGGEISYEEIISEIKSRIPKTKNRTEEEMRKFIQSNLTDKSNGFVRYAQIPLTEDTGKSLIVINRGVGVTFNNTIE